MKTKLHSSLFALLLVGSFLVAAPLSHDSCVAWGSTKMEAPYPEMDGDPDNYNDSVSGQVGNESYASETTSLPAGDRPTFFEKLCRIYIQLVARLSRGRWIS